VIQIHGDVEHPEALKQPHIAGASRVRDMPWGARKGEAVDVVVSTLGCWKTTHFDAGTAVSR